VALSSHSAKAATRIGANVSPEPFSNIALSVVEDIFVIGSSFLVASHPIVMIAIVLVCLVLVVWLLPKILRALRGLLKRVFA
jgi:ABC-type uncharacterized transport system permease subunit